jgi:hypothetical protein
MTLHVETIRVSFWRRISLPRIVWIAWGFLGGFLCHALVGRWL